MNLSSKRVLVTGGSGFLGRHIVSALERHGCRDVVVVRKARYDLTSEPDVIRLFREVRPHVVVHLAAVVGVHRREPRIAGPVLLSELHDGCADDGGGEGGGGGEIRRRRDDLRVP